MFIRRKINASGSITIQVLEKRDGKNVILKTLGTSKNEEEKEELEAKALDYIFLQESRKEQLLLPFMRGVENAQAVESFLSNERCDVHPVGPEIILGRIFDDIGLNEIKEDLFRDMVICRLVSPSSKLKMVEYLWMYKKKRIGVSSIYRFLDKFYKEYEGRVQEIIYKHSKKVVRRMGVVFYDMTTLYFESEDEDDLRKIGFSKDGKFQCPQIMLGLLVAEGGYPITYDIFEGNTWEGSTLINVIKEAENRFKIDKPVVVADSGLLSKTNIELLSEMGYEFIIGARIKNETDLIKKEILNKLKDIKTNKQVEIPKQVKDKIFRLIVSYSEERERKDAHTRKKGLEKLRKKFLTGYLTKKDICNKGYNKFLSMDKEKVNVEIDNMKIKEDELWDGLKGYVTNSKLSIEEILSNYSHLWQIEKAFRISKTDLRVRPIYHRKKDRIEAHICIVFASYAVYKELERRLEKSKIGISPQRAIELSKNIFKVSYYIPGLAKTVNSWNLLTPEQEKLIKLFS